MHSTQKAGECEGENETKNETVLTILIIASTKAD